ncbi:MAG: FTR1 family protein [Burkholderiales bacterium]|nr:FTR1 family protein [Burkholderiales bacterium]
MRRAATLVIALVLAIAWASAAPAQEGAQTILHLLDYIGVDYEGAVRNGAIADAQEYREMTEFSAQVSERVRALPVRPERDRLVAQSQSLAGLIRDKVPPGAVADTAGQLRRALIDAYRIQVVPRQAPRPGDARVLYERDCAACHGAQGRGDGAAAKGLDPAPSNFHDSARMAQRSVYGLYNTITLGVEGTSMVSFGKLSEEERWALAFHIAGMGAPAEQVAQGEQLWAAGEARTAFPDLANVVGLSAREVEQRFGANARRVQAYLRAHPQALAGAKPAPLQTARRVLEEALRQYRAGERPRARDAATSAYLEGFELVESALDNVDQPLRLAIEREMMAVRVAITQAVPADELAQRVAGAQSLLAQAEERLGAGRLDPAVAFGSSLVILLREGLEAILLLAAIIAFIARTGRRDALPWVHAGWIAALAAGAATWAAATFLIEVSGAGREMTEGITALFAAVTLLYVGYWLHGRTQAQAWSAFLRERVGQALEKRTLWAMAGVSFLTVYREIFEVVLFYQALWLQAGQDGHAAVLGGIGAAAVVLAVFGWALFKYSLRIPLAPFFAVMSIVIAALAVVFAGQGMAALQEAGAVSMSPVPFFTLPLLGIHPTLESLGAQLLAVALVMLGLWAARRADPPAAPHAS